eukprot:gnl/TRDRNA2_/TRDRNA2_209820_c0_seq1.p1 gnl/TRDRNA2_/TRDRNA2_209820_c0~~gnl/TRDRNA2_/TRDRNA2_209820_c0_seq1.p1  ORF type:complete len:138 (-),score=12.97 gnl/TRDRNA2_/TRDRNA2_209820_c0_seq1:34-447(-)
MCVQCLRRSPQLMILLKALGRASCAVCPVLSLVIVTICVETVVAHVLFQGHDQFATWAHSFASVFLVTTLSASAVWPIIENNPAATLFFAVFLLVKGTLLSLLFGLTNEIVAATAQEEKQQMFEEYEHLANVELAAP